MKHSFLNNRNKMQLVASGALLAVCSFVLFCSRDYNPFSDLQNARAHVLSWSFSGRDSIPVYMTGTLEVGVALREKVDSFTVSASHNRFWPDTTVKRQPAGAMLDADLFSFPISFCDTGMETVSVCTHRISGGTVTENLFIRSTLPLRQLDVSGFLGDTLRLSTPPVADKDVFYQWDFGPGRLVRSSSDSATAVFVSGLSSGTATINVTDMTGNHATPCGLFTYSLNDTSHPVIRCINDSLHGDTLVTRDSVLAFKAEIVNYGDRPADSCWVNSSAFDISYPQLYRYIKLFKDISSYTRINPLRITVCAIGNKQFPLSRSQKTFWAVFDPTGVSNMGADINFIVPLKDSSSTTIRDYTVFGIAQNYRGDTMQLRVTVNDSQYQAPRFIAGASGTWEWPLYLDSSVNSITVTAYDPGNRLLASKHVTVVYDATMQDRVKPVIWEITAGGKDADNLFTQQANVALQVLAFDEGSGIQSLAANGTVVTVDSSGYIWRQYIGPLVHSASGNRITIRAEDRNHNVNDTAVTIFRNTPPALDSGFVFPAALYVGSSYSFRISCNDADNDPVEVKGISAPAGMVVSKAGDVSWTPVELDAGTGTLCVVLSDGYESAGPFTWTFTCVDSTLPIVPLHFTTRESDFPAILQAGKDTLDIRLLTDSSGMALGQTILRYSALFTDRSQVLFSNDTSPILIWAPGAADTGYRRLMITVSNGFTVFDTIAPAIRVVAMNQWPCSLSWSFTGDTTPAGELNLFSRAVPETLFFAIRDSDDLSTEKYTVTISQNAVHSVAVLNKREFTVIVRPDSARMLNTLLVSISDVTGTSDSATFVIRNTSVLHSKKLLLNTTATGANVAGNVLDFPVLVRLNTGNFDFSQAQKDGGDIRFSQPNRSSLPFEIERFDAQNGIAEIWVRLDTVYGNDSAHAIGISWGLPANPLNPPDHNVFDTAKGFAGVWHLNETNGTTISDATRFGRNGTKPTNATPSPVQGIIGGAQNFSGTINDYISLGTNQTFVNNVSQVTLSAWVNLRTINAAINTGILSFSTNSTNQGPCDAAAGVHSRASFEIQSPGVVAAIGRTPDNSCKSQKVSSQTLQPGIFNYLATVIDFAAGQINIFVNGNLVSSSGTVAFTTPAAENANSLFASIGADDAGTMGFVDGVIDEAEVSRTARSADWIRLCYMNQKAVDALVVFK